MADPEVKDLKVKIKYADSTSHTFSNMKLDASDEALYKFASCLSNIQAKEHSEYYRTKDIILK